MFIYPQHSTPRPIQKRGAACGAQFGVSAWISALGGAARALPAVPSSLARCWHSRATTTGLTKATSTTAMSPMFICGREGCQGWGLGGLTTLKGGSWASPRVLPISWACPGHPGRDPQPRVGQQLQSPGQDTRPCLGQDPISQGVRPHHFCGKEPHPSGAESPFPHGAGPPFPHGAGLPRLPDQHPHFPMG